MVVKSMNKACRKRNSKSIISSMIWTETLYQVWLQRNAKVFRGNIMSPNQIAHTIIFHVATRLDDANKNTLIL